MSDEPDEEVAAPQALGTASTEPATPAEEEEGEIQNGEQTANSLVCNDCQKLFRDGK